MKIIIAITLLFAGFLISCNQTEKSTNDTISYIMKKDSVDDYFSASYPVITDTRPEAKIIKNIMDSIENFIKESKIGAIETNKSEKTDTSWIADVHFSYNYTDINVIYNKNNIFSISYSLDSYGRGAAHPEYFTHYYHYNIETGEVITLDDIFRQDYDSKLLSIAKEKQNAACKDIDIYEFGEFYFNDSTLFLSEKISHAEGYCEIEIPFSKIKDLVNPDGPLNVVKIIGE